MLNKTEFPWLEAPKDSFAHHLKKSSEYLSLNNAVFAEQELDKLAKRLQEANQHEQSEYYYQRGYLVGLIGRREEALDFYKKAYFLTKKIKKYHIVYLENKILYEKKNNDSLEDILTEISNRNDSDYSRLKAKLLALKGNHKEAFELLGKQEEKDVLVLKALILLLSGSYNDCIDYADKVFSEYELDHRQKLGLKSLKARSYFNLGSNKISDGTTVPFTGLQEMNSDILKKAWIELISAWDLASQLGYPPDVETTIDIFCILGMYFDESDIVKLHLIKLARIRPYVSVIQETLLQVAMYLDDRQVAEGQLSKLPSTLNNLVNKIVLASRKCDKGKVVELTNEVLDSLLSDRPPGYDIIITIAAVCANELLNYKDRDRFLNVLSKLPEFSSLIAIYDFITQVNQELLKKSDAIDRLYDDYKKGNKHGELLDQIFGNLNPYDLDSAQKIIEVSNDIIFARDLSVNEYVVLCQAKATCHDWKSVLETSRTAQIRFSKNPRFKAFEALALDGIGDTGKAVDLLEKIVTKDENDTLPIEIYINIAFRVGFIDKAKKTYYKIIRKIKRKKNKKHIC